MEVRGQTIEGRLIDFFGHSEIEGELSNSCLLFEKRYAHRQRDNIKFAFSRVGELWVGKYEDRFTSDRKYIMNGQPAQAQLFDIAPSNENQRACIAPELTQLK